MSSCQCNSISLPYYSLFKMFWPIAYETAGLPYYMSISIIFVTFCFKRDEIRLFILIIIFVMIYNSRVKCISKYPRRFQCFSVQVAINDIKWEIIARGRWYHAKNLQYFVTSLLNWSKKRAMQPKQTGSQVAWICLGQLVTSHAGGLQASGFPPGQSGSEFD